MAKLNIPKKTGGKGAVPKLDEASNNLGATKEVIKFMSFKVDEGFNKRFRQLALDEGITLTELLKRSFDFYEQSKS